MLKQIIAAIFMFVLAGSCQANQQLLEQPVYDLERRQKTELSEKIADLKKHRIILVGEHHSNKRHHRAQLVWDNIMAINILSYLNRHPDTVVVALTGTGHAQKIAVPRQISSRSQLPYAVILPEVPGKIDAHTVSTEEADYIMLDP